MDFRFGSHGRIGAFKGVEIKNSRKNSIDDGLASTQKNTEAVESGIDQDGITTMKGSGDGLCSTEGITHLGS